MENTSCWTAARTDAALSAAHGGTTLRGSRMRTIASKPLTGSDVQVSFAGAPAYVVDQEPHPPRGTSA
jgi:hypothetical protein